MEPSLLAYLPIDRRQALARQLPLPRRSEGTALFADISGFTALTDALSRVMGPRGGAEELTRQLNLVYDALIAEVDRFGGSVIGFSGDAITCWFPGECPPGLLEAGQGPSGWSVEAAARRALACAFAMHASIRHVAAIEISGQATVTLVVKTALASGPVYRFAVGDPHIQLVDVVAGATLTRMAAAEHAASKGEVVADEATVALTGVQEDEWRVDPETGERFALISHLPEPVAPRPWPEVVVEAFREDQVASWLLPAVYERLAGGLGEFLTELRPAVSLFLRFGGIDYDRDENAGEKLDRFIRWVQSVLERYDGALIQLTIGEKGAYLYAAFGAPRAHENDAWRAASAALDLHSLPEDLAFIHPIQIGISQGTMRTGAYGSKNRRTYGVLGDEVNLAARLMQHAAPGQILTALRFKQRLPVGFVWQALEPVRVKGKSEPVAVAGLLGRGQAAVETPLVAQKLIGRQRELAQLTEALRPVFGGQFAGLIFLHGEAGAGKSRLVHELQHQQEQRRSAQEGRAAGAKAAGNTAPQWFTCPAEQISQQALYPFRYFLRKYFNQFAGSSEAENKANFDLALNNLCAHLREQQAEALVQELERTRSVLGALVDLHWAGSLYEHLEPKRRFENVLAAFRALVQAESLRRPVVLHLEDAHWLDADSFEMVRMLTRNMSGFPLAILLTARCRDDGSFLEVQVEPGVPQRAIALGELSPEQVRAMAQQVLNGGEGGEAELSEPVARFLTEKTSGNPLFVEQLTLDLRERGLLRVEQAQWVFARQEIEEVPANLNAVLIARLDRLAAQVKAVVQTAAVLGREFEVQVLSHVLRDGGWVPERVKDAEAELIWSAVGEEHYLFRQTLLRDAAYAMQVQSRLRDLHALGASAIRQVYAADLGPHYAELAYHYGQSNQPEPAYQYARLVGERAASQFASREAIQHYQNALEHLAQMEGPETGGKRLALQLAVGELLVTTGQYEAAQVHLSQALSLASELGERSAQARASRWTARLYELRGSYPEALEWVEQGLDGLAGQETGETAELLLIAGLIHTRQGVYDRAGEETCDALRIADRLKDVSAQARARNLLGHMARLHGDLPGAIEQFQQTLDLYTQIGDLHGQGLARNQIANVSLEIGHWQTANESYCEARRIFQQVGDAYNQATVDNNLGCVMLNQGQLAGAVLFLEEAVRTLQQTGGSLWVLGALHMNLGAVAVRRKDPAAAGRDLNTAQECFEKAQARDFLPELQRHFGEAALLVDDVDEAKRCGKRALELAEELGMRSEAGKALRLLGETDRRGGRLEPAEENLRQSAAILAELGEEYESARSRLALAQVFAKRWKAEEAQAVCQECAQVFARLGAQLDLNEAVELEARLPVVG